MASVVTCVPRSGQGHPGLPYHRRLEKVKFGVPLDQVCKKDIPGPLLVMLLEINKEGPYKKDVFRAPGHQGNTRKLIHFLQQGRLVNIHSFSVNTIASVLKKFLARYLAAFLALRMKPYSSPSLISRPTKRNL